jgi:hypothetical protein
VESEQVGHDGEEIGGFLELECCGLLCGHGDSVLSVTVMTGSCGAARRAWDEPGVLIGGELRGCGREEMAAGQRGPRTSRILLSGPETG